MFDSMEKKILKRRLILATVIFFFLCGLGSIYYSTQIGGSSKAWIINLHGWVEGTEVSISSKVRGELIKLTVDESSDVKKGDLIAKINSERIRSQINDAKAQIREAKAMHEKTHNQVEILESRLEGAKIALSLAQEQSKAEIRQAKARLEAVKATRGQAESNLSKARKDHTRFRSLAKKKSISQSEMDSVEDEYLVNLAEMEKATRGVILAEASLSLAKSSLLGINLRENDIRTLGKEFMAAKTDEKIAKAVIESKVAKKNEIETAFSDTIITAPVNGTVTDKVIEVGEDVIPGTPIVVLTDLNTLFVKTYIEQNEIGKIKLNDPCRIFVDSFPDRFFKGQVILIASKAEFTPRDVQMNEYRSTMVYKIKIGINNPEGILKPGMPADVKLKWDTDKTWK